MSNGIPRPADILQQFGGSLGGPVVPGRAWFFADYEQQRQKNPISVVSNAFADLDQATFGVPDEVQLPPPNAPFPDASNFVDIPTDTTDPVYLQGVANALNAIHSSLGVHPRFRNDWAAFS